MNVSTNVPREIEPLYESLRNKEIELDLSDSQMYFDFPVYKELDESVLVAQTLVISRRHGVLLFRVSQQTDAVAFTANIADDISNLNSLYSMVFTRILRNEKLKTGRQSIAIPIATLIYAPFVTAAGERSEEEDVIIVYTEKQLADVLSEIAAEQAALEEKVFEELQSTVEGSKGLIVPNKREATSERTKGYAANLAEKEIMLFDRKQKMAYLTPINGVCRIRGLAGSGKTVVLCMKAALLHLSEPDARILYTFYTKSLYQHVRRLITRFYRQYNDQDPDWDKIQVRHAWGSSSMEGVYSQACERNDISRLNFGEARSRSIADPFDAVCKDFMARMPAPEKQYDYVLIDEGQDFPKSFIQMCLSLVVQDRLLLAYDDLQTIFQSHAPTAAEIFGEENGTPRVNFAEDIVLPKCYRNPRELLVVAHALGFGIYANNISQMIESEEYWHDIGYEVQSGKLETGKEVSILRPEDNSLKSISERYDKSSIIRYQIFDNFNSEVMEVCKCINEDIKTQCLHPDDIMVLTADDKNAATYLNTIAHILSVRYNIMTNNVHADKFAVGNFQEKDRVTLSTIHKAKGNEAYAVYVVGIDALVPAKKNYRARNLLFTAMTRAKGWVWLSGIGKTADLWADEIQKALQHCPYLQFRYPTAADIKVMQRDMEEAAIKENKRNRLLDELLAEMSPEEAKMYIDQRLNFKK